MIVHGSRHPPSLPPKTRQETAAMAADDRRQTGSRPGTGCSSHSTVFVAAPAAGGTQTRPESAPVQPAQRNGHVVTIRITPDQQEKTNDAPERQAQKSTVNLNQDSAINTIGKFIVNICESAEDKYKDDGCIRISVNTDKGEMVKSGNEMASPYFFCNAFPRSPTNTLMSSGQCSPSDTLDSGTCSDLDGTPPPLPKKKSSKSNGVSHKRVSVTVIGAIAHDRAPSVTSSGAEVDSEDNESNISCDSLNSSDLSTASLHEDAAATGYNKVDKDKTPPPPPVAPKMPTLMNSATAGGFLPQGLLKDIRDRSAKLSSIGQEQPKTSWVELDKKSVEPEEKLTSFKLVAQVNSEAPKNPNKPIIVDVTPAKPAPIVNESTYEDRKIFQEKQRQEKITCKYLYDTDRFYNFHLNENVFDESSDNDKAKRRSVVSVNGVCGSGSSDDGTVEPFDEDSYFAGFKDYKNEDAPSTIRSSKGTIRGVKNRVRAGIKTFLQMQDTTAKSYKEKDAGKVVVYTTSMGIVRGTYQKCLQVKKILRTLLVKFEERDVFMSGEYQEEIKERMRSSDVLVPQIYVDGQHVGDAETIERLNECGELRRMLKPYKSADACTTCQVCGGYRLLPCQVCSGSKKSVHRNHFTAEFVALKCMNCDEVGLVKCEAC